jgi:dTMP kinase
MFNAKLIVIEGLDGAGKSTQIQLIKKYLEKHNYKYEYVHFPTNNNEAGKVVSAYLRGELGEIDKVDPIFVANIYAMDRFLYLPKLQKQLNDNEVVLLDRYVFSNMAYQGAKHESETQSQIIREWIDDYEFGFLELPYPDLNLFFDVPIDLIEERLKQKREGDDRNYLNGKSDIHETNLNFQRKVRENYLALKNYDNFKIIECASTFIIEGTLLPMIKSLTEEEIFAKYEKDLDKLMLIPK